MTNVSNLIYSLLNKRFCTVFFLLDEESSQEPTEFFLAHFVRVVLVQVPEHFLYGSLIRGSSHAHVEANFGHELLQVVSAKRAVLVLVYCCKDLRYNVVEGASVLKNDLESLVRLLNLLLQRTHI